MKKIKKKKQKKKQKKNIGLIFIFFIIVLGIGVIVTINITKNKDNIDSQISQEENTEKYVKILDDGTKLNISEKLKQIKIFENLEIKDIQLKYEDSMTNLYATVVNKSNKMSEMKNISITLIDDNGNTIYVLRGILENIEGNGSGKLNTSITADFANSYDFIINEIK